jgi:hypothetical protein
VNKQTTRLKQVYAAGLNVGWASGGVEDLFDVRLEIDSKIAPYPAQIEAPSFR